jgi:hypothetical protein
VQQLRDPGPDQVHVDGQRGGGCGPGQARLQHRDLGQAEPEAPEFGRHESPQVSGCLQLGQVVVEERILGIVHDRPRTDAFEQLVVERVRGRGLGGHACLNSCRRARSRR